MSPNCSSFIEKRTVFARLDPPLSSRARRGIAFFAKPKFSFVGIEENYRLFFYFGFGKGVASLERFGNDFARNQIFELGLHGGFALLHAQKSVLQNKIWLAVHLKHCPLC